MAPLTCMDGVESVDVCGRKTIGLEDGGPSLGAFVGGLASLWEARGQC